MNISHGNLIRNRIFMFACKIGRSKPDRRLIFGKFKISAGRKNMLYSFLCVMMYTKYYTNSDFMEQFTTNCEENILEDRKWAALQT